MDTVLSGKKVKLRNKKLSDARNDYNWQRDPELARLDDVAPLNLSFSHYITAYALELEKVSPLRKQFAIETEEGKHIGNCVYYGINEIKSETELGIMIGDSEYREKGYGTDAVLVLVDYIFSNTKLNRIHLKTLELNKRAQRSFAKAGFVPCGRMVRDGTGFLLMEMYRSQYLKGLAECQTPVYSGEERKHSD